MPELTGQDNQNALALLEYCEAAQKAVWIRHVLVPGLTLRRELLENLAEFLSGFSCVEQVELLPFHKMGIQMGGFKSESPCPHREPTQAEVAAAKKSSKAGALHPCGSPQAGSSRRCLKTCVKNGTQKRSRTNCLGTAAFFDLLGVLADTLRLEAHVTARNTPDLPSPCNSPSLFPRCKCPASGQSLRPVLRPAQCHPPPQAL